jgi:hypothetical protein
MGERQAASRGELTRMNGGATVALAFGLIIVYGLMLAGLWYAYSMSQKDEEEFE